jgi:hypothetical protein
MIGLLAIIRSSDAAPVVFNSGTETTDNGLSNYTEGIVVEDSAAVGNPPTTRTLRAGSGDIMIHGLYDGNIFSYVGYGAHVTGGSVLQLLEAEAPSPPLDHTISITGGDGSIYGGAPGIYLDGGSALIRRGSITSGAGGTDAIKIDNGGSAIIYGGTITGTDGGSGDFGGNGVTINDGSVAFHGGTMNGGYGGFAGGNGLALYGGAGEVYGGFITGGNGQPNSYHGDGVYVGGGALVTIYGGTISPGTGGGFDRSGVRVWDSGSVAIHGGTINDGIEIDGRNGNLAQIEVFGQDFSISGLDGALQPVVLLPTTNSPVTLDPTDWLAWVGHSDITLTGSYANGSPFSMAIDGIDDDNGSSQAFLKLTPIPEPGTFVLAAIGWCCVVGLGWRRKRNRTIRATCA